MMPERRVLCNNRGIMGRSFHIIVATDLARGIGHNGQMPWQLPEDLRHFREITATAEVPKQNVVIMGRKTWESLPASFRPLPSRMNVVLTSDLTYPLPEGVMRMSSLEAALDWAETQSNVDQVFVMGGGQLYAEAIQHPGFDRLYLTLIAQLFDCDTFFPAYEGLTREVESGRILTSVSGLQYRFVTRENRR